MDTPHSVYLDGKTFIYIMETKPQNPHITVLMAVHNGEQYVREAIDSILSQTYSDFEFVIIDDASTDKTSGILKSYRDSRIVILQNSENLGLTKSLNKGLRISRGAYVARMDADDISLPERLSIQKKYLDEHPTVALVAGSMIIIDAHNTVTGSKKAITDTELLRFHMVIKNQIAHPTVMFRKSTIDQCGGYDESFSFAQDYELWSKLLARGYSIANLPTDFLKYRIGTPSITQGEKTRDLAYRSAMKIVKTNLLRYIHVSDDEFTALSESMHRQQVTTFREAVLARQTWQRLQKRYFETEHVSTENKKIISDIIKKHSRHAFRWYIKSYLRKIV